MSKENKREYFRHLTKGEYDKITETKLENAEKILNETLIQGFGIITYDCEEYPNRLRNMYNPPCVLYVSGNLPIMDDKIVIGVVGSRKMSNYGYEATKFICDDLVKKETVIVSGMAYGIDSIAHETTVKNDGITIAVLGCGIDITYPATNKTLRNLIECKGCVISEFPIGTPPNGRNFPIRNRIISGLSNGILVTEAGIRSGTMITAKYAFEDSRDVFAVPSNIFTESSQGTNLLLKKYAKIATCANDILEEYGYYIDNKNDNSNAKPSQQVEMTILERNVINSLSYIPKHIDDICLDLKLDLPLVSSTLFTLEINNLLDRHTGKKYTIKL